MSIENRRHTLLSGQTAVGAGADFLIGLTLRTVQVSLLGGTLPTATVVVEGSLDPATLGWANMGTATLTGTGDSGLVSILNTVSNIRARVTAITGGGSITAVEAKVAVPMALGQMELQMLAAVAVVAALVVLLVWLVAVRVALVLSLSGI